MNFAECEFATRAWCRLNMTRQECVEFLHGKPRGAFVVRRSSRDNCLALSHILPDASIGHAIIFYDANRGFSVENDDVWHARLDLLLDVFELVFDSDGLGNAATNNAPTDSLLAEFPSVPNDADLKSAAPTRHAPRRPLPTAPGGIIVTPAASSSTAASAPSASTLSRSRPPGTAPPPVPRPAGPDAAVRSRSPPPASSASKQADNRVRSKSPQPIGTARTAINVAAQTAASSTSSSTSNSPSAATTTANNSPTTTTTNTTSTTATTSTTTTNSTVTTSSNQQPLSTAAQVAQLVADLSDSTAAKKALFTIKDMLMTADFARAFVEAGGYQELLRACLKAEGNTLAYGLSALHICLQHYRETDADKHPVALEQQLMLSLSKQFEAVHTGVSKGTLEVFIQLNRRRKVNVYDILRQSHTGEPPCAALVRLLSHADVDCHQRALTLINAVVSGFQQQPLAAKLELYSELSRIGIYEQFGVLRSTTDVMVRTQLCAYQITRFGVTRERMSTPYDKANAEHEAALLRLWQLTFPDVALENRISSQWSKVGFQGTDPATDFRGFGVLGLDAMLYFAGQHTDEWRGVITRNEARAEREYPVATAVINACKLVNDLFHLADGTSAQNDLLSPLALSDSTFEAIVHVAMLIIDRLWDDMNASYMQFPAVIAAAKAELESGASLYISLDEWRAALRRGEKAPVKGSSTGHGAEKSKKSSAAVAFLKRVNIGGGGGGGGGGNAPPPAAPPKPAPMPRPMSARKNTAESGGEVERLKAQLARAQEELAVLRKVQPATNGSTPAAQLSPTLAARNARNLDEIPIGEVFLDEECAHSGRVGGVYYGTWFADRVAVRIFGSNHEELAGKWRRGEPQPSVNADARLACRRELQRLLAAVHPNVCLVIGSIKGAPAVMYELHTCDLRSYLHQFNFTREQRLFLALDAARGISFLHRRSPPIVVGNISTPHFLVDTAGSVRVASLYNDPQQITSKGAPNLGDVALAANITSWCRDAVWNIDAAFAAPEVFARGSLTTASDTFAFGVLLSEVLTGNAPWADATTSQIIQHVLHQDRLPFVAAAAATAGGAGDEDESIVQQLLLGCTHRLPQSRPAMVDVSLLLFEHVSATSTEDD